MIEGMKLISPKVTTLEFGMLKGKKVWEIDIDIGGSLQAKVSNYGCTLLSLVVPDKNMHMDDVVLGFDRLDDYLKHHYYFGSIVGRCANRISNSQFSIDGVSYPLSKNHGMHHLHGGENGFDKVVWDHVININGNQVELMFSHVSKDGHEGYPGTLNVTVSYTFTEDSFIVEYGAISDATTIFNPTHHSYFNLSGHESNILKHELQIDAGSFLPKSLDHIPLDNAMKVEGTPFDFTQIKNIEKNISGRHNQLTISNGFDHYFLFNTKIVDRPRQVATLFHPSSNRTMDVYTTEPGLQLYTSNKMPKGLKGKGDVSLENYCGVCLETHGIPNAPNRTEKSSVVLRPNKHHQSKTIYKFHSNLIPIK